jgi:hypothetical protein
VSTAGAQVDSLKNIVPAAKKDTSATIAQIDITDVLKKAFKIKSMGEASPISNNSNDKKRYFAIFPAVGYTLQTRLAVIVAGNVAFFARGDTLAKLSSITSSLAVTENSQVVLPIQSNIWTKDNKYNLVGDWRISKYPQDTYGLGGTNDIDTSDNLINYSYFRLYQTLMRRINNNFYAGIGYNLDYHWNISEKGYSDGRASDFAKYPGDHYTTNSSGLSLNLLYDDRDNPINPLQGEYANIVLRNNFTFLGSDQNWQSLLVDVRKYITVGHKGNVLAFWSYDWLVLNGTPPYLDLPSTSWDTYTNTGRGYIQGRFRSRQMLYIESEYRYHITRNGLLGGVLFANAQSFSQYPGNYSFQYVQPAAGLGLRVKLNKTSKTNIDIDYGFGLGESHGLFVNIGEVF